MKSYLNNLKAAVINRDLEKIKQIIKKEPVFESVEEAKEIQVYIKEAINIFEKEKNILLKEMQKIKKIKNYTL